MRWASILRIGLPTAVQLSVVNLSYLAVTGLFNACGTACAAAAGVGLKLNTFAAMPCWAVGQAVTTMAGQCMGGGAPDRAARTARSGLVLALAGSGATAALIVLTAPGLIALFDPAPAVVAAGTLYLRICCLGMPALAVYNFGNAVFSAVGDTRRPLYYLSIAGVINVVLNLFFVIVCNMDVAGVAVASIISQYFSAILVTAAMER